MDKIVRLIFENSKNGKIDRQVAKEMLMTLKSENNYDDDIAIIGIAAKFPFADNADEYWNNIIGNRNCITDFPQERRILSDGMQILNNDITEKWIRYKRGGYIKDIDKFDYSFFKISPKEASLMDPNQRLFLENAWSVIEDAGYCGSIRGSKTGVYVGYSDVPYYGQLVSKIDPDNYSISLTGNAAPVIAGRIAYILDLRGPSMLVDTACSSSLVAVHLACKAINNGDCDQAIVGTVKLNLFPVIKSEGVGIESKNYQDRAFDNNSNGTVWGEGIASVFLKPLKMALEDRDNIYAVIKGSAVNQDGSSVGLSAPNPDAQENLLVEAWNRAGINPETLGYIEAHGTGTELGDPIEIRSIHKAIRRFSKRKQYCAIGTVKTNIGHLDCASGIAGLIKATLALKNNLIPPSINFARPNRKVDFTRSPVYVNDIARHWDTVHGLRRCGISAFGFSGTNCHIVLEEAPQRNEKITKQFKPQILRISAKNPEGIRKIAENIRKYIKSNSETDIADLCYTMNVGRGSYRYRLAAIIADKNSMEGTLEKIIDHDFSKECNDFLFSGEENNQTSMSSTHYQDQDFADKYVDKLSKNYNDIENYLEILQEICRLYVNGANIEWNALYKGDENCRISLPGYPFERTRCWIDSNKIFSASVSPQYPMYHEIKWISEGLNKFGKITNDGDILVFKDKDIGRRLVNKLKNTGMTVIEVNMENRYSRIDEDTYEIGGSYSDYCHLFDMIKTRRITRIVYMALSDTRHSNAREVIEPFLQGGVFSLINLLKALTPIVKHKLDFWILSSYVNDVTGRENEINPFGSCVFGLGKVIGIENPHLNCRCVDLDDSACENIIADEILNGENKLTVAYRDGKRYVGELSETSIKDREECTALKPDGVYIITGGTGTLGFEIAKLIASKEKISVILLGRSRMPEKKLWKQILSYGTSHYDYEKIKTATDIEELGSSVHYFSADVSKQEELEPVLHRLRKEFGGINGVIHCAGIGAGLEGRAIAEDTEEIFRKVLSPKVQGTWLLDQLTRCDQLDFFVVFSSPITLIGGVGSASYTAANSFLDSFVTYRNKTGNRTLGMSWAPWDKTVSKSKLEFDKNRQLFEVLHTTQALDAFWEMLNRDLEFAFIGEINYESKIYRMDEFLTFKLSEDIIKKIEGVSGFIENNGIESIRLSEIELQGKDDNSYTKWEKQIATIFGQVLGYKKINIFDNFYELGGDSIIALKIINAIKKISGIHVVISDIFRYPVIHRLAQFIDSGMVNDTGDKLKIQVAEEKEYYHLSFAQKRIFLLSRLQNLDISWNMTSAFLVAGDPDIERVENAFGELIKRHTVLRTSFEYRNGEPVQVIHKSAGFKVVCSESRYDDISMTVKKFVRPFNIDSIPLLRVELVKLPQRRYCLLVDMHHIISDAVSKNILIREFIELYHGRLLDQQVVQYIDFSEWHNSLYAQGKLKKQEDFWMKIFDKDIPLLNLPTDYPRGETFTDYGENLFFEIDEKMTRNLNNIAHNTGVTLFMLLLSAYYILLSKYTNQEDITVGSIGTGRSQTNLENVMGVFINYLPVRAYPLKDLVYKDFLQNIKELLLEVYKNQDYPYNELVGKLRKCGHMQNEQLYSTMFLMQNVPSQKVLLDGIEAQLIPIENESSKLDLTLEAYSIDKIIKFRLEYCTSLFKRETMSMFYKDYVYILQAIEKNQTVLLKDITLDSNVITLEQAVIDFDFNL